ncbi:hypothetical protein TNCV_5052821 [Trichonephila clavipes]|nr:hypothetical protein TNCV_5052821 [Trichonephila clavipes]
MASAWETLPKYVMSEIRRSRYYFVRVFITFDMAGNPWIQYLLLSKPRSTAPSVITMCFLRYGGLTKCSSFASRTTPAVMFRGPPWLGMMTMTTHSSDILTLFTTT